MASAAVAAAMTVATAVTVVAATTTTMMKAMTSLNLSPLHKHDHVSKEIPCWIDFLPNNKNKTEKGEKSTQKLAKKADKSTKKGIWDIPGMCFEKMKEIHKWILR